MDDDVKELYKGDTVCKFDSKKSKIEYGSIISTYGEDHRADHWEKSQSRSQIRVLWFEGADGEISPCEQSDVQLINRKITAGEVYRKKKDNGMKGLCTETKQIAAVQIGCRFTDASTGTVVQHVDGNRFYHDYPFDVGDAVSFGKKVGRIMSVDRLLRLKSEKCNSIVKVSTSMNEDQIIFSDWTCDHKPEQKPYRFYEIVDCIPASLVDPVWILRSETMKMEIQQRFLVESSEIPSVQVYWSLPDGSIEIGEVKGDDVEKLNVFHQPPTVTIGSQVMMKTKPEDDLIDGSTLNKQLTNTLFPGKGKKEEDEQELDSRLECDSTTKSDEDSTLQDKDNSTSQGHLDDSTLQIVDYSTTGFDNDWVMTGVMDYLSEDENVLTSLTDHVPAEVMVWVTNSETKVTVIWQDGTEEKHISSTELHPSNSMDDHEFFPGDIVMLKESEGKVWGVIQSVDSSERVAKVQWSDHALGCPCSSCEQSTNFHLTEHSVYDLVHHDHQFEFDIQDIVHKPTTDGAMLGKIINFCPQNGSSVVKWSDGSTEYCLPGREGFKKLRNLNLLRYGLKAQSSSSTDDGNKNESSESDEKCEKLSEAVDNKELLVDENEGFCLVDNVPANHTFYSNKFEPKNMQKFTVALHREYKLLEESLPNGVWVRAYGDRTDLLSVMIRGPEDTPYEDGLFLFHIQLPSEYPENPPRVHFISYIDQRLNPNLYVEGKVCVSLLGTWEGKDGEVWSSNSNLLQVIVSIQGLILVAEPYYNEPGNEGGQHTQQANEDSRIYNESVILNVLNSMEELLNTCPQEFKSAVCTVVRELFRTAVCVIKVLSHFKKNGEKMCQRIDGYCNGEGDRPKYPLLPVSKGLKLSLECQIVRFRETLSKVCGDSK